MNLPMDQDAESQVIGAMLTDPKVIVPVMDVLDAYDFGFASIGKVFAAIAEVSGRGEAVDPLTVKAELNGDQGAMDRLVQALDGSAFAYNVLRHAQRVKDLAGLRKLAALGADVSAAACDPGASFRQVLDNAESMVFGLSQNGHALADWSDTMDAALEQLEYRYTTDSVVTGIPTGLQKIDHRLTGLHPGWLVYIGARPGEGKTALALQLALHAAEKGHRVLFASLEMSGVELATRAICARAMISYTKIRRGALAASDWQRFVTASGELAGMPVDLYDAGKITVPQIMSRVRHTKPELLVVDYVGLVTPHRYHNRKDIELAEISGGLKAIAKEARIPVVVPVQLNRNFSKREDKSLSLEDLRDSGAFEQDADVVYLLQRVEKDPQSVDLKCAKFRHGPTGIDRLRWDADITSFRDGF